MSIHVQSRTTKLARKGSRSENLGRPTSTIYGHNCSIKDIFLNKLWTLSQTSKPPIYCCFIDVHICSIHGCEGNEHQKQIEADRGYTDSSTKMGGTATHSPFANLKAMIKPGK